MKKAVSHLGNVYKVGCSILLLLIIIISYTCPFYTLAHNRNTQFIFKYTVYFINFAHRIYLWPKLFFFLPKIFSNRLFFCEPFSPTNSFFVYNQSFHSEIYLQQKFIFNRNIFPTEICFPQRFFSDRSFFPAEIYFQPEFVFDRYFF